jgi:predicted tellurium resistance membrane protein TerC
VGTTDAAFTLNAVSILAITRDPFLVFTSNAFAILGVIAATIGASVAVSLRGPWADAAGVDVAE